VIRINKPADGPGVLRRRGIPATRKLCEQIDADPAAHGNFAFDGGIYGHRSVKDALREAQHGKCAFCESKIAHISPGDVEHFRPKAGHRQAPEDPLVQPGYYWLAYEWSNLLFCCQLCNQQFKGNHFPLANPTQRAKSHRDDISREEPLLINPAIEDPSAFLEFRENMIHAIKDDRRGQATIEIMGLNRVKIAERRLDVLDKLKALLKAREAFRTLTNPDRDVTDLIKEIDEQLNRCADDNAEYAAMIRAALRVREWR
jgi:uncharacterized protein (TIGR02646 family)